MSAGAVAPGAGAQAVQVPQASGKALADDGAWLSAWAISRHSAMERQPSSATRGPLVSSSASGLSMPAAVNAAAPRPSLVACGPSAGSNTVTSCVAPSRQASKRPSRPAPAIPMDAMAQPLVVSEGSEPPTLASPVPPRGCCRSWGGPANDDTGT